MQNIQLFYFDHGTKKYTETNHAVETYNLSDDSRFGADLDWAVEYAANIGDMVVIYSK